MREEELKLIKSAQEKDNDAINQILEEYRHLVKSIARKYFLIGGDAEDVNQVGMMGLFKAINSFNVDKNDNFSAYASIIIQREIISAIRKSSGLEDTHSGEEEDVEEENFTTINPETEILNKESQDELIHEIYSKLSSFERLVADYYLQGYNYKDIAVMLGKSSKSIDNALSRMKKKLEYLKEKL